VYCAEVEVILSGQRRLDAVRAGQGRSQRRMSLRVSISSPKFFSFSITVAALIVYDASDTAHKMPDRAPYQA
jgi:hypothetical protein